MGGLQMLTSSGFHEACLPLPCWVVVVMIFKVSRGEDPQLEPPSFPNFFRGSPR